MTSYKNESIQTKAIKLSRLSHLEMICLLLNSLTECNFHSEVKVLERTLSAPVDYWSDKRTSKMASTLAKSLEWDGAAVARVIVNASKNQDIENALRSVGLYGGKLASARQHHEEMMAKFRMPRLDRDRYTPLSGMEGPFQFKGGEILYYDPREGKYYDRDADMYLSDRDADRITSRTARHKLAGKGLKVVEALGIERRKSNHFLHALAGEIIGGDIYRDKVKPIEGAWLMDNAPGYVNTPYEDVEEVDGVVGIEYHFKIEITLDELEKAARTPLTKEFEYGLQSQANQKILADAMTKNINGNILANMDDSEIDEICGEPLHYVQKDAERRGFEVIHSEIESFDYEVLRVSQVFFGKIYVDVTTRCEYNIEVEPADLDDY